MSVFDEEVNGAIPEILDAFGEPCTYNGTPITAIFEYEEIETEAGFQRAPTIQFDRALNLPVTKGLPVTINGQNFTVKRPLKDDTPFEIVELNLA